MRIAGRHAYAVLAAATLAAGLFAWSVRREPSLSFRDRAYPQGFRELVLEGASSRLDPLAALPQTQPASAAPKPSVRELCDALFGDASSPAVGSRDSPVQIAAFLDYRCPYCKTLANIMTAVQADNVRMIYKEWPILGDSSLLAARAALAADRQGRYLAFHARLMNTRLIPTARLIEDIAAELAMNQVQLRDDMRSRATASAIARTSALAQALGFIGTPALVVGRTIAQGEITRRQLERLIEDEMTPRAKVC